MARISIEQLLTVLYTTQHQEIEDVIQTFYDLCDLSKQSGQQLVDIGHTVGLSEFPTDDDELRAFITAQIGANSSDGTFQSVYAVWKTMSEAFGGTVHKIFPAYPQQLWFETDAVLTTEIAAIIKSLLESTVSTEVLIAGIAPSSSDGDGIFKYDSTQPALDGYDVGVYTDYY